MKHMVLQGTTYLELNLLVAIAVGLHVTAFSLSDLSKSHAKVGEIAAKVAKVANKSGQTPPNPGQAYSHCITPEPTVGPSSYICRWCVHKKSREKMHSGSRAGVRKSLGRVRLI